MEKQQSLLICQDSKITLCKKEVNFQFEFLTLCRIYRDVDFTILKSFQEN